MCRACVAKHHAECWAQLGRCGTCGNEHSLQDPTGLDAEFVLQVARAFETSIARGVQGESPRVRKLTGIMFAAFALFTGSLLAFFLGGIAVDAWRGTARDPLLLFVLGVFMTMTLGSLTWASHYCFRTRIPRRTADASGPPETAKNLEKGTP